MQAFKSCVEEKSATKGDCMYFLEKYTRGRPRDIVQSCVQLSQQHTWLQVKLVSDMYIQATERGMNIKRDVYQKTNQEPHKKT